MNIDDKIKQGRQYRNCVEFRALEVEDENDKKCSVEGYATTFNDTYVLWSDDQYEVREQIDKEAFNNCDMSDVIFQYNHEGRVFARISNNTLSLSVDENGLKVRADLGGTEEGRKLYEEIKGGYTTKMSFGFTVGNDVRTEAKQDSKIVITRTITAINKLYDVSAVSIPANDGTEISARSYCDGLIAEAQAECLKREKQKQKIRIMKEGILL